MEYGDTSIKREKLYMYQGFDPDTVNLPPLNSMPREQMEVVNQRDGEIFFLWQMVTFLFLLYTTEYILPFHETITLIANHLILIFQYKRSENELEKKAEILKQIQKTVKHRKHLDGSVELIGTFLFGPVKGSSVLNSVRPSGSPLVDNWKCLKSMVNSTYSLIFTTKL